MSLPDSQNPVKIGASVKSGLHSGPSKRGKAPYTVTGDPGDYVGGPQPVPYPGAGPHPQAPPRHAQPAPLPHHVPQHAMPSRMDAGMAYQAPGITQGYGDPTQRLLWLLMGGG